MFSWSPFCHHIPFSFACFYLLRHDCSTVFLWSGTPKKVHYIKKKVNHIQSPEYFFSFHNWGEEERHNVMHIWFTPRVAQWHANINMVMQTWCWRGQGGRGWKWISSDRRNCSSCWCSTLLWVVLLKHMGGRRKGFGSRKGFMVMRHRLFEIRPRWWCFQYVYTLLLW